MLQVDQARAGIALASALTGGMPLRSFEASGIRARLKPAAADLDTLAPIEPPDEKGKGPASPRVQRPAEALVRLLLVPARRLPGIRIEDFTLMSADSDDSFDGVRIERLATYPGRGGVELEALGSVGLAAPKPFEIRIRYGSDDRLHGVAQFALAAGGDSAQNLMLQVDATVRQDRSAGVIELGPGSRLWMGGLPLSVSGSARRAGPRFALGVAADSVTSAHVHESQPPALLGPLEDVHVTGSFDYRLQMVVDFGEPDSSTVDADVIPHGLALDPSRTVLRLHGLEQPFLARIHLPRDRIVLRDLSPDNPNFRPLETLDSNLVRAVVTNEDGSFFSHHGFNADAVRRSMAENLRAGAYRRGAGTITMQLARNLYLGHERRLARKLQEAVLAWIIEHLTWATKERLLEIYLNIIEWGPEVHGANEAAHYYFGHDATHVTVPEALFLSTVVPSPRKWRYRFDANGDLRPFARAQMHFIGRAMTRRGWLPADSLPPADSMRVVLSGKARAVLFPPPDSSKTAVTDSDAH